ncbi:hypothetical protein AURDEDRAFT_171886 [Auricularia subglabra TFB-10046 SS5]|uniref:F-box domain-containing protein n=1 Tax=Auricularia subglabra (strain TFB-10046 / SS5) TaxID=717982 RepID=J0WVN9_AURST|nr:hypothetical protein AURDEDRAFT_171886 [Auricularia subglabra TFB-10046 SS5]
MTVSTLAALPGDILYLVCQALLTPPGTALHNLAALSSTCKQVRAIALPLLLRHVSISDASTAEESRVQNQLGRMVETPAVRHFTQSFNFAPRTAKTSVVVEYCPTLIQLLKGMTQLRELKFDTLIDPDDREDVARLCNLFLTSGLTPRYQFKSITNLCADECCVFLLAVCPEVRTLRLDIIHRPSTADLSFRTNWPIASRVQYLQLRHESYQWETIATHTPEFCQTITNSMPNVTTLVMNRIRDAQLVLPKFNGFAKLETLVVPDLSELGLGFCPPRCGNALRGARGTELRRKLEVDYQMASKKIKALALDVFPRLRKLWIGWEDMCDLSKLGVRDQLDGVEFETSHFEPIWEM